MIIKKDNYFDAKYSHGILGNVRFFLYLCAMILKLGNYEIV